MLNMREATPDDLATILDLYRHLHSDDAIPPEEDLAAVWSEIAANPSVTVLLGEIDSAPVASCTLVVVPNLTRGAKPWAVIENVVTHGDHRSNGYGSQVMRHAISLAFERGCYKVMLLTGSKREATLRFYEEVGLERGVKTGFVAYA